MSRPAGPVFLIALFVLTCLYGPVALAAGTQRKDKIIVIIGASSGFGKGAAMQLAKNGDHLVLAARRTELLNQLAQQCGNGAVAVTADVTKPEEVQYIADVAIKKFGHVDVWINDVGVGAFGHFEDIPLADHSRLIDVNLKGIVYGSHIAMRIFRKQGYGILINLGSMESEIPIAYHATYAATKAAVLSLDQALAQEIRLSKNKRIKVCTVMPWAVDTPWWDHAANYSGGTARMAAMDGPNGVVNAMVKATRHPSKQLRVGWKAKAAHLTHRLVPGITERSAANINYQYQMVTAPPAAATSGSLYEPMASGTEIEGGVRARMKKENEDRKMQVKRDNAGL